MRERHPASAVAAAIADGAAVDWVALEHEAASLEDRALCRQLHAIATAVAAPSLRTAPQPKARPDKPALWPLVSAAAAVKIAAAVFGASFALARRDAVPVPFIVNICVFGVSAFVLITGGGRDRRARHLGLFFGLIAASFTDRLIRPLESIAAVKTLAFVLRHLPVDAFLAFAFWCFAWSFPSPPLHDRDRRIARGFLRIAAAVAVVLFVANVVLLADSLGAPLAALGRIAARFDRYSPVDTYYWLPLFGAMVPALPYLIWKSNFEAIEGRRRTALFTAAMAAGITPMLVVVIASPFTGFFSSDAHRAAVGVVVYIGVLSIAPMTAYAALVRRVLDVRLVVSQTLQFWFVRYGVVVITATPLMGLAHYIYANRHLSVAEITAGRRSMVLLPLLALLALTFRDRLFRAIDRRFLRAPPAYPEVLARLERDLRDALGVRDVVAALVQEVDRAIHPRSLAALVTDQRGGSLVALTGGVPPLRLDSTLGAMLLIARQEICSALDVSSRVRELLAPEDRQWLTAARLQLLVPLVAAGGELLGVIAVGEKRNELPFTDDDRLLLGIIASRGGVAIATRSLGDPAFGYLATAPRGVRAIDWEDEPAALCLRCRRVWPSRRTVCECGSPTVSAALPYLLRGKFRVERHLGSGGMSVVYLAMDLALDRRVAIKTLPRVSAPRAARMQQEARAMAAVQHPNLATIFGVETWRSTPLLLVEYLEGGTLADRLALGRRRPEEAMDLGIVLADVLDRVHGSGVLHRDIKPSNIGYTRDGAPKLLDFGVAQVAQMPEDRPAVSERAGNSESSGGTSVTRADGTIGTPAYLSPEAVTGAEADPLFDLWSLALVLYEAVTGVNPFGGKSLDEVFDKIRRGAVPDIRTLAPACSAEIAAFFADALSVDRSRRPQRAAEFRNRVHRLRADMDRR
jgi:protein kinase-like protein